MNAPQQLSKGETDNRWGVQNCSHKTVGNGDDDAADESDEDALVAEQAGGSTVALQEQQ